MDLEREDQVVFSIHSVGLVCAHWAYAEYLLEILIWSLLGFDQKYCKAIAGTLDITSRARMAFQLAPMRFDDDTDLLLLEDTLKDIEKIKDERNLIVHGVRTYDDGVTGNLAMVSRGKMKYRSEDYVRINDDGLACVDLSNLTRDQMAAIGEINVETTKMPGSEGTIEKVKFKLADKGTNLERLGKHLKLFTDRHEIGQNLNVIITGKDADLL